MCRIVKKDPFYFNKAFIFMLYYYITDVLKFLEVFLEWVCHNFEQVQEIIISSNCQTAKQLDDRC